MEFISFLHTSTVFISCLMYITLVGSSITASASTSLLPNETDHLALLAFKAAATGEDSSGVLSSWNQSLHFCHWEGVSCSSRHKQRVVSLDLHGHKLRGVLSPHIGNLSFLRLLDLSNNSFTGEIPHAVGRLFRLQVLALENNTFVGEIPVNLSYCSNIQWLLLRNNKLEGRIPVQLGSLEKIKALVLRSNNLIGDIPSSLGNLSSLLVLRLEYNILVGTIPRELARLQRLNIFGLGTNHLSGTIPPQLYNLSNLNMLSVSYNQKLHGSLPLDIGLTLPNLEWLGVEGNRFTGTIPISLLNCSKLKVFQFSDNMFSGKLPDLGELKLLHCLVGSSNPLGSGEGSPENDFRFLSSLTNCTNLHLVGMADCSLSGSIPVSVANLSSRLESLSLNDNYIYGSIPTDIGNLVSLKRLSFSFNDISGHIPNSLSKLQLLELLYLNNNRLTGTIPSSLGNLTKLSKFRLSANKFYGSIPSSLKNCMNLLALNLSFNNLTGAIPTQLFSLPSLSIALDLSFNSLTGPLPSEVGKLIHLVGLNVSNNKLSGAIPSTLGKCEELSQLLMQGNAFDERIPESLSGLKGIEKLDLSHNNLTGKIPDFLGDLPFLNFLDLSFNDLEGAVPQEGKFKNASIFIVEGNHKLCGGISKLMLPLCPKSGFKGKSLPLKVIAPVIGGAVCWAMLVCFVIMGLKRNVSTRNPSSSSSFNFRHFRISYAEKNVSTRKPSSSSSFNFRHFRISYAELLHATNSFSEANLLGVGNYSSVYKGVLDRDETTVAVKVLNLQQRGGSKSFTSECEVLKSVRHRNLLKILTSCSSVDFQGNDFKALVFEFMPNGSLDKWLYPESGEQRKQRNLNLLKRLDISIDAASALVHLHHHSQPTIVHCDIKPSNVLLDGELRAHLGDFGLGKLLSPVSDISCQSQSSSLAVKGSIGYVAPEYGTGSEASTEGDVYSFGILLIEMFTGKRPTDDMFRDGSSLHSLAKMSLTKRVVEIIDPRLLVAEEDIGGRMEECLTGVIKVGVACSMESPGDRMQMGDVVKELSRMRDAYQAVGIHGDGTKSVITGS